MSRLLEKNEVAKDLFLELSNIAIGKAAASMSELTGCRFEMSVPELNICQRDEFIEQNRGGDVEMVYASQVFHGDIPGLAIIVFDETGAAKMTALMCEETPEEGGKYNEDVEATILELGNMVIGAIVSSFVDRLGVIASYEVPEICLKKPEQFGDFLDDEDSCVISIKAKVSLPEYSIECSVLMLFKGDAQKTLTQKLNRIL